MGHIFYSRRSDSLLLQLHSQRAREGLGLSGRGSEKGGGGVQLEREQCDLQILWPEDLGKASAGYTRKG